MPAAGGLDDLSAFLPLLRPGDDWEATEWTVDADDFLEMADDVPEVADESELLEEVDDVRFRRLFVVAAEDLAPPLLVLLLRSCVVVVVRVVLATWLALLLWLLVDALAAEALLAGHLDFRERERDDFLVDGSPRLRRRCR